jgi:hypothetical protein
VALSVLGRLRRDRECEDDEEDEMDDAAHV